MNKTLKIVLIAVLSVVLALGVFTACTPDNHDNEHECTSKCQVCGGCKNSTCTEDACKNKCTCSPVPVQYTVLFDLVGGNCSVDVSGGVKVNSGAELDLSAYAATKQDYVLESWTDGTNTYEPNAKITVSGDLNLTANWKRNVFAVTFVLDGGVCSKDVSAPLSVIAGTELKLTSYAATKDQYTFAGWTDGTNTYAADATVTVNKDITLTATWQINVYTVTLDVNGGSALTTATLCVNSGDEVDLSAYVTTKKINNLVGWSDGTNTYAPNEKITVTGNLTLTAQWQIATTAESEFKTEDVEGGVSITGLVKDSAVTTVVVPKQIGGKNVVNIGYGAFSYNSTIEEVYLDAATEITALENNVFSNAQNLRFVSLKGLSKLQSIGDSAFYGVYDSTGKYQGSALETVDFTDCTALKTFGQMVFAYQYKLQSIDLSVCTSLETIERQMFDFCVSLTDVKFPASLQSIANNSDFFRHCYALQNIEVAEGGIGFESQNGILYTVGKTELVKFPAQSAQTEYVAPATITKVWGQAFGGASKLASADFSACTNVALMGGYAFEACSKVVITVPFTSDGRLEDGTQVELGNSWYGSAKKVNYQTYTFVEISFSGVKNNSVVSDASASLTASATYGSESVPVVVTLNGVEVSGTDGVYALTYKLGENTIVITATNGIKSATETIKVTYKNKPTVSATLEEGQVFYGDTIEFDVTAKTATGDILTKDNVNIQLNFSGTYMTPFMGLTVADALGGKVHVSIDIASLIDMGYFDGGAFKIKVIASDGGVTAEIVFNVDHKDGPAPVPTISSTLVDGKTYYGTIAFDITATDASGNALTKDGVEVGVKFSDSSNFFVPMMGYTISDVDGKVHVEYDMASIYSTYFFDSDFQIRIAIKGSEVEVIYNVTWLEGEEPHAEFSVTGLTDGYKFSKDFDVTVTAIDENGKAIPSSQIGFRMTLWANKWVDVTATVKSESNGVIVFTVSYNSIASNYQKGMFDPFSFSVDQKDASGAIVNSVQFNNVDLA